MHGVPYEEVQRYPTTVVPALIEMLRNPAEQDAYANIAVTLGMLGDDRAVEPLIEFIKGGRAVEMPPAIYRAKTSAVMPLGYIVDQTGNQRALSYLETGLDPSVSDSKLAGTPLHSTLPERNRSFGEYAILGLALTGKPEAAVALRRLQQQSANRGAFTAQL